jgi:hypothetical protein
MSHVLPKIPPYGELASPEKRRKNIKKKRREKRRVKGETEASRERN